MSGTICIVDDEPAILNTLSSILEDEGYQVTIAKTGREALGVIQQEPPDVVLLDIWIPEFDGLEVLKRVREQFPNVMVIMMSGHGSVETGVKAMKLGAYDYLEKPLDLEKVPMLVRNAMNQRKLEEENLRCRPNVFRYATKELSQDAVICWLIDWAGQSNDIAPEDELLRRCGRQFVSALLNHKRNGMASVQPEDVGKTEVLKQEQRIDVLARINGKQVPLIEDKTDTKDRNEQLERGYNAVIEGKTKLGKVAKEDLYPIYLKTGNQSLADDHRIEKTIDCNYKVFNRADFLGVLNSYRGCNSTLVDFRRHLQYWEDETNSYVEWTQGGTPDGWHAWEGFYRRLEGELFDGTQGWNGWNYVPNESGGFLGFLWGPSESDGKLYLQIETKPGNEAKLCFKVSAKEKTDEEKQQLKRHWHKRVMDAGAGRVVRPRVLKIANYMTVACWKDEWLAFGKDDKLDISNTVENLKQAESVWKKAIAQ